jgi:hypothetical protein
MKSIIVLMLLATPSLARAWDGDDMWTSNAEGMQPGGAGNFGTGGARDKGIQCAHCHVQAEGLISGDFAFSPALGGTPSAPTYVPGTTYQVTVRLIGEHLGLSGCGQYLSHVNNFAAAFENGSGQTMGVLIGDSGMRSDNCQAVVPMGTTGTTVTAGDCHAIFSHSAENLTRWTFSWVAPSGGSGAITMYYGLVDGNCDMMSMKDDVKVGTLRLGEAMALAPHNRGPFALAALPIFAFVWAQRRKRS